MSEFIEIYNSWSLHQTDNQRVKDVWKELQASLNEWCNEADRTELEEKIDDYSKEIEEQAFIAGYKKAFLLMMEIFDIK
ncbi:MAG TPA: hypothetical protein DCZ91_14180 [Lachnospiraceae bacterium]|nr:hypothetical protein [Lachnospiraceae bacterium]